MTEVLFYHLQNMALENVLPPLLEKSLERGWRVGDAHDQPIVLAVEQGNPNKANVRFLIDNAALPEDCGAYERLVVVFNGDDGDALAAARAAWTDCKSRGFEVTYWQADERGRWQRRE